MNYYIEKKWCGFNSHVLPGSKNVVEIQSFSTEKRQAGGKNNINLLKKDDGNIPKDKKEMEDMTKVFFQRLYTADQSVCPDELVQFFEPRITEKTLSLQCHLQDRVKVSG
jgi:hypothetical protein